MKLFFLLELLHFQIEVEVERGLEVSQPNSSNAGTNHLEFYSTPAGSGPKIKAIDESLDEADRLVRPHIFFHRFRQKQQLHAICS